MVVVFGVVAYGLVVAEAFTAAASLLGGDPWDWDQFGWFCVLGLMSVVTSSAAEALARRGVFGSASPQKQRQYDEDDETRHAVHTGLLPPGADRDQWLIRIRRFERQNVTQATLLTVLSFTAALLTATAAHLHNQDDPVLWTMAAATLIAVVPPYWLVARARHKAESLVARLGRLP
jgi:hypothetical protein